MEFAIVLFYCYVYVSIIPRVSIVAFAIVLFILLPFSSTLFFSFFLGGFFSIEMSTAYIFGFHFQIPFIDASRVDEVTAAETKAKT